MKLKNWFVCLILSCIPAILFAKGEALLVIDRVDAGEALSKNFRRPCCAHSNHQLHASASGQFSASEFQSILSNIPTPDEQIWIVDLRQESHGFLDGIAISWYSNQNQANINKTPAQIQADEQELLDQLRNQRRVTVYHLRKIGDGKITTGESVIMQVCKVASEQQLVEAAGAKYKRLYVLDHHRPDDQTIEEFVSFVREQVSPDDWLHFHCRGGKGRSSTFMAMFDILQNAKHDSFAKIMRRQIAMGNKDLSAGCDYQSSKAWKQSAAQERYAFLKQFYCYAADGYPQSTWDAWLKKRT